MKEIFIGIDPGAAGGLAILDCDKIRAVKCPDSPKGIWDALEFLDERQDRAAAVLEAVHSFPADAARAAFSFGTNYGLWQMALIGSAVPYDLVSPQKWKKVFGNPPANPKPDNWKTMERAAQRAWSAAEKRRKKLFYKEVAERRFPEIRITDWNADAALLAEYCRIVNNQRDVGRGA